MQATILFLTASLDLLEGEKMKQINSKGQTEVKRAVSPDHQVKQEEKEDLQYEYIESIKDQYISCLQGLLNKHNLAYPSLNSFMQLTGNHEI